MSRIVRSIDAYYEKDGPFGVDRDVAEQVLAGACEIISPIAGQVAIGSLRAVAIRSSEAHIAAEKIALPAGGHQALLSGRSPLLRGRPVLGVAIFGGNLPAETRTMLRVSPTYSVSEMAAAQAHEIGHSLIKGDSDKHCPNEFCLMYAAPTMRSFCDDCASDLELAGYSALAKRL